MPILIDTSIWSLALRRRRRDLNPLELKQFYEWERLVIQGEATAIGLIAQEALTGVERPARFEHVQALFNSVPMLPLPDHVYSLAASFSNMCRSRGIAPGAIDMTICAAAQEHAVPIFSCDGDFERYATLLPIKLHRLASSR